MKTSGGSPPFRDVQETLDKAIEKKGEKAKVLFLMDASLTVPEATGLERHCHCERPARQGLARLPKSYGEQAGGSVAISGIAEPVPKRE
jgi:hypothetical protein